MAVSYTKVESVSESKPSDELTRKQKNLYSVLFRHFAMRLLERYGVLIVFEDYVVLSRNFRIRKAKRQRSGRVSGFMKIKGKQVRVVKSNDPPALITALPIKKKKE